MRTCIVCRTTTPPEGRRRCAACEEVARTKQCSCGSTYIDRSLNNTRRFCDGCAKSSGIADKTERRRAQVAEATRRWVAQHPGYVAQWNAENPGKALDYARVWRHRKWRDDPVWRDRKKQNERERRRHKHQEAIEHYGARCTCCGETRMMFLSLDHVNGGGSKERRETGLRTEALARRQGWPSTFQVLCHNCNFGKHLNGGVCPHETEAA